MKKAVVVLSGGQDSATCAAWAKTMFDEVEAVSFFYKQKHSKELEAAKEICQALSIPHTILDMPVLMGNKTSGLTNSGLSVTESDSQTGLPKSFVPGRNLLFLNAVGSFAISKGIYDIVTGVCQTDYSGYPDCRRKTIDAVEQSIYLGNQEICDKSGPGYFHIHTPLMYLTKAESVTLAQRLPRGMEVVAMSWTCYEGGQVPCGVCGACDLRIKGFKEAGVEDPGTSYWGSKPAF